jgi:hypothetical protein
VRLVLQACEAIEDELEVIKFLDELREIRLEDEEKQVEGQVSKVGGNWRSNGRAAYEEVDGKGRWALALDLKSGLSKLREDTEILSEAAFEDSRHMAMAIQADVTIEERTMEARHQRTQVEELKNEVYLLIRQLDSDIDAALSRRKWSYEQIESQCEELLARCETTTNTYKNQLALTPSTRSRLTSFSALLFIPLTAAASYWYWNKKFRRR